jgi:heme oxygenase
LGQLYPLLPDIQRAAGFQKDIAFYKEDHVIVRPPEVDEYVDYLKNLEKKSPAALLAYFYHMYMAIFAGGFIIKKIVTKSMKLTSEKGVQAFVFEADPKVVRETLKDTINNMHLTKDEEDLLMEEGPKVFLKNDALVEVVKRGNNFQQAEADCSRLLIKITLAVLVVAVAVGIALMQSRP